MKSKELKNGTKFQWETKDKEHIMIAVVGYNNLRGQSVGRFFIHFNGVFIHTCKGFKSLETRFAKLIDKWDLELMTYDEEFSPI